jgi:L-ascorbate metabolism protein UlaG (beta-lactamase superfamily)
MKLTYYGHSCFGVEVAGRHLLFDPFITPNERARAIDVSQVRADFLFISHAHADHLADAVAIAKRTGARVLANYEIYLWATNQGIQNAQPLNHGGRAKLDFGQAKFVNAVHSSSFPDGSYGGNPGGWVVETAEGNFYYSGDTALTTDMALIGESTRLKFAALCIGDTFTMGVSDATKAAQMLHCDQILGVHYDTFPPIEIDHASAVAQFRSAGKTLHLVPIGQSLNL